MFWANFLHIYQPPTQKREIVEKVAEESYRKILDILWRYPEAKLTLNISSVLTEQLQKYGLTDIIDRLEDLSKRDQIEFTGSAKYHPILPLIPEEEINRQIRLNEDTNRDIIGRSYQPTGFFPPEMCYRREIANIAKDLGYSWIIIDEIGYNGKLAQVSPGTIYTLPQSGLTIFFKERRFSSALTYGRFGAGAEFEKALKSQTAKDQFLLTGTDGEIYGHHRKGQEKLLEDIFRTKQLKTLTISELPEHFHERCEVEALPCSWSTWEDELAADIPFPQWRFPGNEIHGLQWQLAQAAMKAVHSLEKQNTPCEKQRRALDEGLHSDQFWWASCRPWWDVGMIRAGALKLLEATKGSDDYRDAEQLVDLVIEKSEMLHASGDAKRLQKEYLETHKEVTSLLAFG